MAAISYIEYQHSFLSLPAASSQAHPRSPILLVPVQSSDGDSHTKHSNRPPRPSKHSHRPNILLRQGILDGGDEEAGDGGDGRHFDGGTDGVFGLVEALYLVLVHFHVRHVGGDIEGVCRAEAWEDVVVEVELVAGAGRAEAR